MNELMIPEGSAIPAYILNADAAKQANADACAGISTGFAARLKLNGKAFALVDGNGEETPVKNKDLTEAADENMYLPMVVLRAKPELQKAWYAAAYKLGEEGKAPDCFSNDGMMPDASVAVKQCESCAACQMNAYGSGKDQDGNPTGGKACSDNKILAVFVKGGIYKFKIPPASLKTWALFVKQLGTRGIPVGNIKTLVGFDDSKSYPVLRFEFGGFMEEKFLPALAEKAASTEAEEIVNDSITAGAPKALQAPTPAVKAVPKVEPKIVTDDTIMGLSTQAEPKEKVEEPVTDVPDIDDLAAELGL